ncbi:uncharacterized protein MICPUCDRAFT_57324 [Micromonas pusilla CCMP1545]|uniref:Predicted protein n=2 Tax=Micromonas pusilla TaxID=38833 RepID=C1MQK5_MICPC|nr:uncharacterized protein MICPUCDRAFT_57324 [Micromonas pusilla CCMP1545]EEH58092.1 predicted protein [Micromonas pusilla CCMP1545]|eukprot:XP_003058141.1 predicted protein [Micromonas pusilla CCMP1545]
MPPPSPPPATPGIRIERRSNPGGVNIKGKEYAIAWLSSEPVNSMTLTLWRSLLATLDYLENDATIRGVVFASDLRKPIFTAGNDINELHAPSTSATRYAEFWKTQTTFLCRLLRSPLSTVCAIRGACPAGGCAVSLCCDYRAQTTHGTFGLNEVALGIPVPKFWARLFVESATSRADATLALLRGALLSPAEAKGIGLIHELAASDAALLPTAERALATLLKLPDDARAATKANVVRAFSEEWEAYIAEEARGGWAMLNEPAIETAMGNVIERLSSGKGKGEKKPNPRAKM